MRYVLLLESAYDNGKLCSLSHRAFRLWANSLSYARKHQTDGRLRPDQVTVLLRLYQLTQRDVDELVEKRGWERVEGGFAIHHFLEVNPSEEELAGVSEVRADAGRRGGLKSAAARRKKADGGAENEAIASKQNEEIAQDAGSKIEAKRSNIYIDGDLEGESERDSPSERIHKDGTARAPEPIERVRALAVPKPGQAPGSPQVALSRALAAALNCAEPTNKSQRARWAEAITEMIHATPPVAQGEIPRLVDRFRESYTVPCTPQAIVNHLSELRAEQPAPKGNGNAVPKGWDNLRIAREHRLAAGGGQP